jgi:ferrochelatase
MAMAEKGRYAEEVRESSALVAKELNHRKWSIAYQSRSGPPSEPWLGPDISTVIRELKKKGEAITAVVPIGFLCENAEILYDLDGEAKKESEQVGLRYLRAETISDHPKCVAMFTELIQGMGGIHPRPDVVRKEASLPEPDTCRRTSL